MKGLGAIVALCGLAYGAAFTVMAPLPGIRRQVASQACTVRRGDVVMRERKCDLLGKRANRDARLISFSHIRTKTVQGVNLQEKRVFWAEGKKFVRLRLSTKGWKTVKKYGLDKAAKKFELDLDQFSL